MFKMHFRNFSDTFHADQMVFDFLKIQIVGAASFLQSMPKNIFLPPQREGLTLLDHVLCTFSSQNERKYSIKAMDLCRRFAEFFLHGFQTLMQASHKKHDNFPNQLTNILFPPCMCVFR